MSNLPATPGWDNVWQWDDGTRLIGGTPTSPLNLQAQALVNRSEWLRSLTITPIDPQYGCAGDGVTDDYVKFQAMIDSLKHPSLDFSTPAAADASIQTINRVIVDLQGKKYKVSQPLDLGDLYYVEFHNGTIIADSSATWGSTPILYIAKPQATDMDKIYRVQYVRFFGVIIDGNYVANCVYLENTFGTTFDGDSHIRRWVNGGYGLSTSVGNGSPKTKNGRLYLGRLHVYQVDLTASGLQPASGTGISLQTADFTINGTKVNACATAVSIDNMTNGQIVALHAFVGSANTCLYVGPGATNLAIDTIYMDTGLVTFKSFSHTVSNGIFVASSQVQFVATVANEDMAGLYFNGIFDNQPQYLTQGSGSWAPSFKCYINGRLSGGVASGGARIRGRGGVAYGRQNYNTPAIVFTDDTSTDSSTGLYSPAANEVAWSTSGVRSWGIDSSGRSLIGSYGTSVLSAYSVAPSLQMHSTAAGGAVASITRWSSSATSGGQMVLARSNSDTIGTYSALATNQVLGRLLFAGDNGTDLTHTGAAIAASAYSTWSGTNSASKLTFYTTSPAASDISAKWDMRSAGHWIPVGDISIDIGESANRVRKLYTQNADITGTLTFPGPYASDSAAATAGIGLNGAYRHTDGTIHWRQT